MFEERRVRLPALGVAHAEARVPVSSIGPLAHDLALHSKIRVEGGPPGVVHAMDGPDPTIDREVRGVLRMPILRVSDEGPSLEGLLELRVRDGRHLLSVRDVQASVRVGEVVLDIDDQERCSFVVDRHGSSGGAMLRPRGSIVGCDVCT